MRASLAKKLRKLIGVGQSDDPITTYAKKAVYRRAKKILARDPQADRQELFSSAAGAVAFLVQGIKNRLESNSKEEKSNG